jgi:hypothetical protein
MRVAVFLTECVSLSVLACKMEHIHSKANILKDWVILDHFTKRAFVVEKNVIWHKVVDSVGLNDHFLDNVINQ